MMIQKDKKGNDNKFGPKGAKGMRGKRRAPKKPADDFDQKIIEISRVTRVTSGGKRMRFRACVVVGDKKGQIGLGVMKGADVSIAINKAVTKAKKDLVKVKMIDDTIPHRIETKFGGAVVMLKPAPAGTGIISGGVVRAIVELAGIKNIVGKIKGSKSKINNAKATVLALRSLYMRDELKELRK